MAILYMDIIEYKMTCFFLITQRILQSQTIQESMVPIVKDWFLNPKSFTRG